jgi:menaquinone-dependent protoporphyrinogen oxidase
MALSPIAQKRFDDGAKEWPMKKVLVAFGSKYGSTGEIAAAVADVLRRLGLDVDLRPARDVRDVDRYDGVVVGSGVYVGRWHGDALDLIKRFERELRTRPTWFFSSGPTGGTPNAEAAMIKALEEQAPPPGQAGRLAERIGIRGHALFAGSVGADIGGFFARWIPKGDWREFGTIETWAAGIGQALDGDLDPGATDAEGTARPRIEVPA